MPVKASYLFLAGAGGIALYSGVKGKGLASGFRQIISGKSPTSAQSANQIIGGTNYSGLSALSTAAGTTPSQTVGGSANSKANMAIARLLCIPYGWSTGSNWNSLVALWNQESGWNQYAYNPSGATGIPQALPYNKMPQAAWLPSQGGSASPSAQIAWGLSYIKSTYGSPDVAWGGYWQRGGWY